MATNEQVLSAWIRGGLAHYTGDKVEGNSLSTDGKSLWSYALKIAETFDHGKLVLILPHGVSTSTTNSHIIATMRAVHSSVQAIHVFHAHVLDPSSMENIARYDKELYDTVHGVLNKRRNYNSRYTSCLHYYDLLREVQNYWAAATHNGTRNEHIDEPVMPSMSILDKIEEAGDLKFLGQLALEGNVHRLHDLDDDYRLHTYLTENDDEA